MRDYLRAYIKSPFETLRKQLGIEKYKNWGLRRIIEMLLCKSAANGFGSEYDGATELREAF